MENNKSFTLIELLVVIAIIGLLASIVLVSMGGIQSKAKITKTLQFSQSVNHVLGAYAVGWWNFDEGSGATALDNSGYGNNGTINGASYTDDTPHKAAGRGSGKYALSFDGANDYVDAGTSSSINPRETITASLWVKPNILGSYSAFVGRGAGAGWTYISYSICYQSGNWIGFFVGDGAGDFSYSDIQYIVPVGQWTHIAGTYDKNGGSNNVKLYINGIQQGTSRTSTLTMKSAPTESAKIGYTGGSCNGYFNGLIDEVRIYEKALTLGQIQKLYAEGLERHKDLATR